LYVFISAEISYGASGAGSYKNIDVIYTSEGRVGFWSGHAETTTRIVVGRPTATSVTITAPGGEAYGHTRIKLY
jgi:hypothetical protein